MTDTRQAQRRPGRGSTPQPLAGVIARMLREPRTVLAAGWRLERLHRQAQLLFPSLDRPHPLAERSGNLLPPAQAIALYDRTASRRIDHASRRIVPEIEAAEERASGRPRRYNPDMSAAPPTVSSILNPICNPEIS